MRDWRTEPLERIAEIRSSNVDKKTNPGEEPVRLCNYMDVYSREYITEDIEFMEATATPAEIQRFGIERGDVMITKDSETPDDIGIPAVVVDDIPKLVCGYHVALIKPNRAEVDPIYLAKQLGLSDTARYYGRLANGSTRYGLSYQSIARTPIRLAPLPQQQRIAEILSTVDEAIEQTEALIAKTQQIKAGLMHDLFTRGVTADGQLRPPREEAPQLYKESPLGWIPKEWSCETLDSLLAPVACPMRSGPFGSALLKEELVENGIPLLGIDNVFAETFVAEYRRFVTPHKFVELSRYAVLPGDVIITIMGTVGRCCVVPEDIDRALSSKHLWTMTFYRNKVLPELVCWQLNYAPWVKSWFARQSQGAVMDAIQSSTLRTLWLPVPPPSEQVLLRDRYVAIQAKLSEEDESLCKLRKVKRGLMQDLLMGAVSVGIDTAPEPKEVAANV